MTLVSRLAQLLKERDEALEAFTAIDIPGQQVHAEWLRLFNACEDTESAYREATDTAMPTILAALRMQERLEQMRERITKTKGYHCGWGNCICPLCSLLRDILSALDGAAVPAKEGE